MPISLNADANPPGAEFGYDQITASVTILSTTEATPTPIIAGATHIFDGTAAMFTFFSAAVLDSTAAAGTTTVLLMQDGLSIGRIAFVDSITITTQIQIPVVGFARVTPTAGAHIYSISAFCSNTAGAPSIGAGLGGSGVAVPAFLRATKC